MCAPFSQFLRHNVAHLFIQGAGYARRRAVLPGCSPVASSTSRMIHSVREASRINKYTTTFLTTESAKTPHLLGKCFSTVFSRSFIDFAAMLKLLKGQFT